MIEDGVPAPIATRTLDALNGLLVLDRRMLESFKRLEPHLGARDLKNPRRLSPSLSIPAPIAATMMNYLHEEDDKALLKTVSG